MNIFQILFYQPLLNALVLLYQAVPGASLGFAIILLTILIKVLLFPLNQKALRTQRVAAELEPKLKELRERLKGQPEKVAQETMVLYREAKINPFSSLILLFVQLPILIALYQVFSRFSLNHDWSGLYSFVAAPGSIRAYFLGINLSSPNLLLALLSTVLFFVHMMLNQPKKKVKSKDEPQFQIANLMQKQMTYIFPIISFFILLRVPSAVGLYLLVSSLISIGETKINKSQRVVESLGL